MADDADPHPHPHPHPQALAAGRVAGLQGAPAEPVPAAQVRIGRDAWVGALREAVCALPRQTPMPRELLLWSRDFVDWPLDEPELQAAWTEWLRAGPGRLVFIGHDFEVLSRRHPRLLRWRRDWSHRIDAWRPTAPVQAEPLGLLWSDGRACQLLDNVHWRTRTVTDAPLLRSLREQTDACLQQCEPAWPVTTLGL